VVDCRVWLSYGERLWVWLQKELGVVGLEASARVPGRSWGPGRIFRKSPLKADNTMSRGCKASLMDGPIPVMEKGIR